MEFLSIDSPARLREAAGSVVPFLDQGTLEQLTGDSLREIALGSWGDLVESTFRCTACGNRYELQVETYHGSGGAWRRCGRDAEGK